MFLNSTSKQRAIPHQLTSSPEKPYENYTAPAPGKEDHLTRKRIICIHLASEIASPRTPYITPLPRGTKIDSPRTASVYYAR